MAEKTRCEICDRNFKDKESLEMHNAAKHSKTEEKKPKKKLKKGHIIWSLIFLLVFVGVYFLIQSGSPSGEDFSRAIPVMSDDSHVADISFVEYNSNPPTSGPHYATPARPGFRENIIEDGYLIHSMEHGLIWISYNPRIGEEAEKLRDIVGPLTVITQREANDEDIAIASWGRLDTFNLEDETIDADDLQRINDFIQRYANKGPEFIPAGQHGGI